MKQMCMLCYWQHVTEVCFLAVQGMGGALPVAWKVPQDSDKATHTLHAQDSHKKDARPFREKC